AAENWPVERIKALGSADDVPQRFKGRKLLTLCNVGMTGAAAARHLRKLGLDAANVRGGMQEWVVVTGDPAESPDSRLQIVSQGEPVATFREAPWYEQWAQVISGFGMKYTYMALSAVLIVVLLVWSDRQPDLMALMWGQVFFLIGEAACAVNYVVFNERSYLTEYAHGFGMLLCFGFTAYAVFEGMDRRLIKLSDADTKCAALQLCRRCIKYDDVPCGLKRMFYVAIPATIVIAFMPLCASLKITAYNTRIMGTLYTYVHPFVYQAFEARLCPIAGIVLLAASLAVLVFKKDDPVVLSKVLFAAGMGPVGFSMLRTIFTGLYADNLVWSWFWEEGTELLFVAGVCFVLWIFRAGLFPRAARGAQERGTGSLVVKE
ncbi:unnamed protein product, partial [marine sediment metagenome]